MREVEEKARRDRRTRLAAVTGYDDPELFAAVDAVLHRALLRGEHALLIPHLLDDEGEWRAEMSLRISSHRPVIGPALVFVKRRLLLPLTRWLFEYSRENFRRQQRVNRLLAACIEELALENARLRQELSQRAQH